jgi:undecaprenyl-phosphate 4-deoxy-4-formamido-L-arabinose transferase
VGFFVLIIYRRLAYGPEAEGLFTLFAIAFLLLGVALFGIGLLGEYVGRIYQQVRERPRYLIQAILEAADAADEHEAPPPPAAVLRQHSR